MNKVLIITFLYSFILFNAQDQKKIVPQKFYGVTAPHITKENLKIPTLQELLEKTKNVNAKDIYFYVVIKDENAKKYEICEEKKDHTILTSYGIQNGKIFRILKYKRDKQKYTRKKIYFNAQETKISQTVQSKIDFYSNGKTRTITHVITNEHYPVGKWYAYGEDGSLLQEIDHDKYFKLNFFDVLQIADAYEYPNISIGRGFNDIHSYWYISLDPYFHDQKTKGRMLLLDDKTKEIIYDVDWDAREYLSSKQYDKLNIKESSLEWLRENDLHQIPDEEFYKNFRGY